MKPKYDREAGDIGNIVALEHVNLQIEEQGLAISFYVTGLGLTRDPYMMTGVEFMWVNAGRNQFHLVTGPPQVVSGHIGLVVPDLRALLRRLETVRPFLSGTQFDFGLRENYVETTCPWGNRFRCYAPDPKLGGIELGIPYVEFDVEPGTATRIAAFYRQVIEARSEITEGMTGGIARILIGLGQELRFRETSEPIRPFDGHHVQIYVANFSGPHRKLVELNLVTEESNQHQYRFDAIVDLDNRRPLARIEHEIRSLRHPLYARPLVNRNPMQSNLNYVSGRDAWIPSAAALEMDDPAMRALQIRYLQYLRSRGDGN